MVTDQCQPLALNGRTFSWIESRQRRRLARCRVERRRDGPSPVSMAWTRQDAN